MVAKLSLDVEDLISTSGEFLEYCYPKDAGDLRTINPKDYEWILDELVDRGLLTAKRRDALVRGKPLSASERKRLRLRILAHRFGNSDCDITPAIFLCEAPPEFKSKRVLVFLSRGYSFSIVTREFFGAFRNKEMALSALRKQYFLETECAT